MRSKIGNGKRISYFCTDFIKLNPMLEILYEDNHIIAVNKKNSDIVQGDKTGDTPLSEEVKS